MEDPFSSRTAGIKEYGFRSTAPFAASSNSFNKSSVTLTGSSTLPPSPSSASPTSVRGELFGDDPLGGRGVAADVEVELDVFFFWRAKDARFNGSPEVARLYFSMLLNFAKKLLILTMDIDMIETLPTESNEAYLRWTIEMDGAMLEVLREYKLKGHKDDRNFSGEAYRAVLKEIDTRFGLKINKEK
ncbi:hypothetical protein Tsubulata_003864, partial [Turnera subulata]